MAKFNMSNVYRKQKTASATGRRRFYRLTPKFQFGYLQVTQQP